MLNVIATAAITQVIDVAMNLGQTISDARTKRGWSQRDLARESGVSQPAILKIEKGQTRQSKFLPAVLRALGLPLELLAADMHALAQVDLEGADRQRRIEAAKRMLEAISDERRLERVLASIEDAALAEEASKPSAVAQPKGEKKPE